MKILFILLIAFIGISTRLNLIGDHPDNFTPMLSIAMLSGFYIKNRLGFLLPLFIIIITDFYLGLGNFLTMFGVYFSYILIFILGKYMLKKQFIRTVQVTFSGSVLFFIITNFMVWLNGPHAYDLLSFIDTYQRAIPFFRNQLISTISFSVYFYLVYKFLYNYEVAYDTSKSSSGI